MTPIEPPSTVIIGAWYVVQGFVDAKNLCICGTVDAAIQIIYKTLERYPDPKAQGSASPGTDVQAIFAAYVLDSWDLLSHSGSIDAGAFRTEQGEILYQAMRTLDEAGEPLLPDLWRLDKRGDWEPPGPEVPWWARGGARQPGR